MELIKPQVDLGFNPRFLAGGTTLVENQPMVKVSDLWREIDVALKARGKSQSWLAEQLDLSDNAITKWKRTGKISRENAVRVSDLLGIPIGRLLKARTIPYEEVITALPEEDQRQILGQLVYHVSRSEAILGSRTSAYLKMIDGIIKDMEKRKKQ